MTSVPPSSTSTCLFCRLIAGDEPVSRVGDDGDAIAVLDPRPINPGHTLVLPAAHASGLTELSEEAGLAVWRLTHRVAVALRRAHGWCEGVTLHLADGKAADQDIPHVHLHVIPRLNGDGLELTERKPPGRPTRAELDETAATLSRLLTPE